MAVDIATPRPDENFEDLISNWRHLKDRIVLFLGAGASIGARNRTAVPLFNAYELRNALWSQFKAPPDSAFDASELRLMSLEHAAAIIEAKTGRQILIEYLLDHFRCDRPLWQHAAMTWLRPKCIFTTNYDELVELGYKHNPDPLDVICEDRSPVAGHAVLYKPHGSLSHAHQPIGKGGLVITQFDYFEMIAEYRKMLRRSMVDFGGTCVLIVGYSFADMDIGSELYRIRKEHDGIPWYAVFPRNDPSVRRMYSQKLKIEQIDRTFEQFLAELDARVELLPERFKHSKMPNLRASGVTQ